MTKPTFAKTGASFLVGTTLGLGLILPAVQTDLSVGFVTSTSPIAQVLFIGVIMLVAVTTGMFALFQLFVITDR